jgi:hypothetical protein
MHCQASACDPNGKYVIFSLYSHVPAFSVLIASWSFATFLMLAAFEKHPKFMTTMLSLWIPLVTLRMWAYPAYAMTIWGKKTVRGAWRALYKVIKAVQGWLVSLAMLFS